MSGRRSVSSVNDYPEHLNPFYEGDHHNRIRFWDRGKKLVRANSFSISDIKALPRRLSFRSKTKTDSVQVRPSPSPKPKYPVRTTVHVPITTKSPSRTSLSSGNPFDQSDQEQEIPPRPSSSLGVCMTESSAPNSQTLPRKKKRAPLPPSSNCSKENVFISKESLKSDSSGSPIVSNEQNKTPAKVEIEAVKTTERTIPATNINIEPTEIHPIVIETKPLDKEEKLLEKSNDIQNKTDSRTETNVEDIVENKPTISPEKKSETVQSSEQNEDELKSSENSLSIQSDKPIPEIIINNDSDFRDQPNLDETGLMIKNEVYLNILDEKEEDMLEGCEVEKIAEENEEHLNKTELDKEGAVLVESESENLRNKTDLSEQYIKNNGSHFDELEHEGAKEIRTPIEDSLDNQNTDHNSLAEQLDLLAMVQKLQEEVHKLTFDDLNQNTTDATYKYSITDSEELHEFEQTVVQMEDNSKTSWKQTETIVVQRNGSGL